jgi:general stress protein YciG
VPRDKENKAESTSDDFQARFKEYVRELGRRGGKKRSQNLTPERRREIARNAALKRWSKPKRKKK